VKGSGSGRSMRDGEAVERCLACEAVVSKGKSFAISQLLAALYREKCLRVHTIERSARSHDRAQLIEALELALFPCSPPASQARQRSTEALATGYCTNTTIDRGPTVYCAPNICCSCPGSQMSFGEF
jgi:hypothetical protein